MKKHEILSALQRVGKPTILVFGDLILDRYLFGNVERLSPEAPVPVLEYIRDDYRLGGAANVANNIGTFGGNTIVAGVVGDDEQAENFTGLMRRRGIDTAGVIRDKSRPTIVKTRVIGGQQQLVRIDREDRSEVCGDAAAGLSGFLKHRVDQVAAVVISDYGKGVVTAPMLDLLRELTRQNNIPVVVDPKDTHFSNYRDFTVVTPNEKEASLGAGYKIKDRATLESAGKRLVEILNCDGILITRGAQGMSLFRRDRPPLDIPTRARGVFDVTGAGDTVVSILALSLASGLNLVEAAHLANWAAGVAVGKHCTATVSREELIDYIKRFADV